MQYRINNEGIGRLRLMAQSFTLKTAKIIAEEARKYAPVRSGRLRNSISAERISESVYAVQADTPYAGIIERRRPYLAPAADKVLSRM